MYAYKQALFLVIPTLLSSGCNIPNQIEKKAPNIIVILVDDMGYSDIGCYGGEVHTPNLDLLADNGIRFTQFYNAARCCPTRASLLTGLYPHQAGMGAMTRNPETSQPGPYQGYINNSSVTIAEALKSANYYTAISGKWHVGDIQPHWPLDRGFDNFFGLIGGAGNLFDTSRGRHPDRETLHVIDTVAYIQPDGFYMTDAITEHGIGFIEKAHQKNQPLFLYLSYTAPHWPMQAWQEDIDKYRGRYMEGWDKLSQDRLEKMTKLGLFDALNHNIMSDPDVPAWETLSAEEKDRMDLLMSIYAAMIDRMDQGIGKIVERLKSLDEWDNTLILFLSDNGASSEYDMLGTDFWGNGWDGTAAPGSGDSFLSYGQAWANFSNLPFRLYKKNAHEGGIATPLITHWPNGISKPGRITDHPGHIIDIMATCLDIAGVTYPKTHKTHEITPNPGISLTSLFKNETQPEHESLFWEHTGNKAVRKGHWKLVAEAGKEWELYDLSKDRFELNNLIQENPEVALSLILAYETWANQVGVRNN